MRKDIVCILAIIAFAGVHVQPVEGIQRIMRDLLIMTKETMLTTFTTLEFGFNNTRHLIQSCVDTMNNSELTRKVEGIQDNNLRAAQEGLINRFIALSNELKNPVREAMSRITSIQETAASCETSLQKVCDDLIVKVGSCSSIRINAAISQVYNCMNDGMEHINSELVSTKRTVTDMMDGFKDLRRKTNDCYIKVDAARCLNEVMRQVLPQYFMNAQKHILAINDIRPSMEPLTLCTAEIVTDVPRICSSM